MSAHGTRTGAPSCPICADGAGGASASEPIFMAGGYRMYRCAGCRASFVHPMPSASELARFYDAFHEREAAGGWYDEVEARMQADFKAKVDLLRQASAEWGSAQATGAPEARRPLVLDVGCGKGFFVKACVERGIDAQGVDLSESGVRYARETLGVRATAGLLADVKPDLGVFDAATFWATIEHLPDPVATLRDIRDVLKPGGLLLLDTGIGDDWLDRMLPGRVQWFDPPQHLFVFSRGGMERALGRAGFRLRKLDPIFERSPARRAIRIARSGGVALALRASATLGRLRCGRFGFLRFPLGNLMSVVATREG